MKKLGRPSKAMIAMRAADSHVPMVTIKPSANKSLLETGLQMAKSLLKAYQESKLAIAAKYRTCDKFKEGAEYRVMMSREIGHIESIECLIKEFEELLK